MGFPDQLVQQFRQVAIERLDRVEQAWAAVMTKLDEESATIVHRELHTLKGESRMLGFSDVNLVCHKLEDMFEVARIRGYAIDEDFDLAVNMAIRFMAMLVRKKVGAQLSGIDLPGFVKQIDGILAELRPEPRTVRVTTGAMAPLKAATSSQRIPGVVRARLGPIAVDAFVEYAVAKGVRRDRLRASWHSLRDMIGIQRAALGPNQLSKHAAGGQSLAVELGKQVNIQFELETVEATAEVLAAVDSAVLHLVRNAIDHGIETPAERTAAGKSPLGAIRVRGVQDGKTLIVTIEDDGRGIAIDEVRKRAIDRGLISSDDDDISDRWLDIVCQPGFTTRTEASDVSGRGVGLDVVRVGIHEIGGALTATTAQGRGTSWRLKVPLPQVTLGVWLLRAPGLTFPIAIEDTWALLANGSGPSIDLAHRLGIDDTAARTQTHYFERDGHRFGFVTSHAPQRGEVRRLVAAATFSEVIVNDTAEGLLIHPDR